MAKRPWHYTDRKTGKRTEVMLDDEQQAIDVRCVQEFEALQEAVVTSKVDPNTDPRTAQILEWSKKLPPLKAQHWAEELARIGVNAGQKAAPAKVATAK